MAYLSVFGRGRRTWSSLLRLGLKDYARRAQEKLDALDLTDYAAPYVNRIDNLGYDGVQVAKDIHDIFQKNGRGCQVLAASFQNTRQVLELCRYGVGAVTAAPEVIEGFVNHPGVDKAVAAFLQDFEKLAGAGKTMANC